MKKSEFQFLFIKIITDVVMIFLGLIFAYFLRMHWFSLLGLSSPTTLFPLELFYGFAFQIAMFLVAVFALNGRYKFSADEKAWDEVFHLFWNFSSGMALLLVFFFFAHFAFFSRFIFGVAWLAGFVFLCVGRMTTRSIRTKWHRSGYGRIKILILGTGTLAQRALDILLASPKFHVLGALSEGSGAPHSFPVKVIGTFDDFEKILKSAHPDEVLLATENSIERMTAKLVRIAHINHVQFRFLPDELGLDLAAVEISTLGNLPLVTLKNTCLDGWGYVLKSTLDFVIAGAGMVVVSPVLAVTAWKIWRENPRAPIFYGSKRIGRHGKTFLCWKFRTMIPDAEEQKKKLLSQNQRKGGVLFKMENDPRITSLGKTIRKWSLDELPQLWNVIRGDMSIIGPRPHLPEEVARYAADDRRILFIKPGITGFSQVNGRSSLSFKEEMNYELFYLKNWSFWLDVIIFFKSIAVVVKRKNAV